MKPILTQTVLFKQVEKVLGRERAIKELLTVINSGINVNLNTALSHAFGWRPSPQGSSFWNNVYLGRKPKDE